LIDYLQSSEVTRADIYLDSPVSHSERHAALIRSILQDRQLEGNCNVIRSADYALRNSVDTVLATSDTGIIDSVPWPVTDLPRLILERKYGAVIPEMSALLRLP
jgi:hypothetical protein